MTKKQLRYYNIYSKFNTSVLKNILRDYNNELKDLLCNAQSNIAHIQNISERIFVVQDIIKHRNAFV